MQLEEKIKIIQKAEKKIDGKITMKKYKELSYKDNEIPPIYRILKGHRWNEIIAFAFKNRIKTMADAQRAAKIAKKESGEENLTINTYRKYAKKIGAPGYYFIKARISWREFKAKYVDENILDYREIFDEKVENEFCNLCLEKEGCEIKLEDCQYWKEWKNEHSRKVNC